MENTRIAFLVEAPRHSPPECINYFSTANDQKWCPGNGKKNKEIFKNSYSIASQLYPWLTRNVVSFWLSFAFSSHFYILLQEASNGSENNFCG